MILDFNLAAVPDLKTTKEGEYAFEISSGKLKEGTKKDKDQEMLVVVLNLPKVPNSEPIFHNFMLPKGTEPKEEQDAMLRRIKNFAQCIKWPLDKSMIKDPEALVGKKGTAIIIEKDSADYGIRNEVKKWIVGK